MRSINHYQPSDRSIPKSQTRFRDMGAPHSFLPPKLPSNTDSLSIFSIPSLRITTSGHTFETVDRSRSAIDIYSKIGGLCSMERVTSRQRWFGSSLQRRSDLLNAEGARRQCRLQPPMIDRLPDDRTFSDVVVPWFATCRWV